MGFFMSLFATDELPGLLPKIQKWLEVRTPNEGGILAFLTPPGGTPSILLGVTYNGAVEEGQRKIDDMVETAIFGKEMKDIKSADLNTQLANFAFPGATMYQTSSIIPDFSPELVTKIYKEWETVQARPGGFSALTVYVILTNWDAASKINPQATPFNRGKNQVLLELVTDYTDLSEARKLSTHLHQVAGRQSSYLNTETEDASSSALSLGKDARAVATFGEKNLARLREIKARYDPERRFRSWFG